MVSVAVPSAQVLVALAAQVAGATKHEGLRWVVGSDVRLHSWLCVPEAAGDAIHRRQELSYECKATLFDQEVRMAENIDFQFPMKKACSQDIQVGTWY